jgi:hypothetical protein
VLVVANQQSYVSFGAVRLIGSATIGLFGCLSCTSDTGPLVSNEPSGGRAGSAAQGGSAGDSRSAGKGGSGGAAGSGDAGKAGRAGAAAGGASAGAGSAGKSGTAGSPGGNSGAGGAAGSGGNLSPGGASSSAGAMNGASGASDGGDGGGAGAPASGCGDLPICDGFESYSTGQTPNGIWSKQGGGSATVDTTRPFRGDKSVHIQTGESEAGRVWLHTTSDRLFPTRHLFGRLWLYLDALPTTEVHWDMIEALGTADEPEAWDDPFEIALRYGGQLDENFLANFETPGSYGGDGPRTDCAKFSDTRMPAGRWACMEWEFDSDAEVMRFWLDGEAVEDLEVHKEGTQCISDDTDGVWYYPTFEALNLGWREWWEAGTRELWIDEVAVGAERIGCE